MTNEEIVQKLRETRNAIEEASHIEFEVIEEMSRTLNHVISTMKLYTSK